jgi:hypothetical protein
MAAANAPPPRGQRAAIFASKLSCLVVDCLTPGCGGERTFAMSDLAGFYGAGRTVGDVLRRMRCSGGCGGRPGAAWLVTGPLPNTRVRPRRVATATCRVRFDTSKINAKKGEDANATHYRWLPVRGSQILH